MTMPTPHLARTDRPHHIHRPRRRSVVALAAALAVLAACTPDPVAPGWTPTVVGWNATPGAEVERPLAATSSRWFVVVEQHPAIGPAATSSNLLVYPRTGADAAPASIPSQIIPLDNGLAGLAMSEHVIAVRVRNALANLDTVQLYGLDPTTDTWSLSTVVPRGLDDTHVVDLDVTDTALVIGDHPSPIASGDGSVVVVPLAVSGASISWSFASIVSLAPNASWSTSDRQGFGRAVSIDGDWLAVSSGNDHAVVYHRNGATWPLDLTLTNPLAPGSDGRFARSVSIDDTPGGPRLAVGVQGGFSGIGGVPTAGRVELFTRGAAGWSLASTIAPRAGSALGGFALGVEVGLDADRVIVGYFWAQVAGAGGTGSVDDYRLEVWNLAPIATPSFDAELSPLDAQGGPLAGQSSAAPVGVELVANHVVVDVWNGFGMSPSHFSAVSWDRHPAG